MRASDAAEAAELAVPAAELDGSGIADILPVSKRRRTGVGKARERGGTSVRYPFGHLRRCGRWST